MGPTSPISRANWGASGGESVERTLQDSFGYRARTAKYNQASGSDDIRSERYNQIGDKGHRKFKMIVICKFCHRDQDPMTKISHKIESWYVCGKDACHERSDAHLESLLEAYKEEEKNETH